MKRINVLLAEDHTVVREGFCKLMELEDDFEVVAEAQTGRDAVAMDIAMPQLNGLEAIARIHQRAEMVTPLLDEILHHHHPALRWEQNA